MCLAQSSAQISSITTSPLLPYNVLATGFVGLELHSFIDDADIFIQCGWMYQEATTDFKILGTFFVKPPLGEDPCRNVVDIAGNYMTTCITEANGVNTTVTLLRLISHNFTYSIQCLTDIGSIAYADSISITTLSKHFIE